MSYKRVVSAALAETSSKFMLAEALALDIPPHKRGPAADDASVSRYLEQARLAIIDAGGEPRAVKTLDEYRRTALWVSMDLRRNFAWVAGSSFSAHNEARARGLSYDEFAAAPKTVDQIRRNAGTAGTDGPPARIAAAWSPDQQAEAAEILLRSPKAVAAAIRANPRIAIAAEAAVSERRDNVSPPPPSEPRPRQERDYDLMVDQGVHKIMVALAAESSGKWTPSDHSAAYLYFLSRALLDRPVPEGDFTDEFADIERFANETQS